MEQFKLMGATLKVIGDKTNVKKCSIEATNDGIIYSAANVVLEKIQLATLVAALEMKDPQHLVPVLCVVDQKQLLLTVNVKQQTPLKIITHLRYDYIQEFHETITLEFVKALDKQNQFDLSMNEVSEKLINFEKCVKESKYQNGDQGSKITQLVSKGKWLVELNFFVKTSTSQVHTCDLNIKLGEAVNEKVQFKVGANCTSYNEAFTVRRIFDQPQFEGKLEMEFQPTFGKWELRVYKLE